MKNKIISMFISIYLFYLINFRRGKLKESLSKRKERDYPDCKKCGLCCKGCIAFTKEGLCRIWKDADYRCKTFPVSHIQLKWRGIKKCRYYWE